MKRYIVVVLILLAIVSTVASAKGVILYGNTLIERPDCNYRIGDIKKNSDLIDGPGLGHTVRAQDRRGHYIADLQDIQAAKLDTTSKLAAAVRKLAEIQERKTKVQRKLIGD